MSNFVVPARVTRTPVREIVYDSLLDLMSRGELVPGEIIRDEEIATWLGVSRPPVREALAMLEANGFVNSRINGGVRIAEESDRDIAIRERMLVSLLSIAAEAVVLPLRGDDRARVDAAYARVSEQTSTGTDALLAVVEFDRVMIDLAHSATLTKAYRDRLMPMQIRLANSGTSVRGLGRDRDDVRGIYELLIGADHPALMARLEGLRAGAVAVLLEARTHDGAETVEDGEVA
ncbi:GntR family transcriptional regulator [Mycetocola sp. JXN-3]|uniref:GntR family transcriptional regulator n=1 Tax=Mycetocola sp. JXN-3 TaxID=2116510 RepID=UPI00165CFF2E|nr:GntR family transcriptional regulator [Mycetocola sp. JXN-3]